MPGFAPLTAQATLTPTPLPAGEGPRSRPGPRLRRGRPKARAPVARKPSPLARAVEGLAPFSHRCSLLPAGEGARRADEGTSARTCRHRRGNSHH
ncbi:hypothetical protein DFG55_08500 [Xanthomonas campestris pv. campestris]|nr:hypothetical protein DFG55_08500 [Xanthomonas campestris pv. campestris]QCX73035.1 hypothetical protein DFG54_21915 [Xanthomonas campestris pv. campestris]